MKFLAKKGITKFKGDQSSAKECYSNSLKKVEPRDINVILNDIGVTTMNKGKALNNGRTSK